jgi:hypothetical protein
MIWKSIPGFEGAYEVSNTGAVRSVDRNTLIKGIVSRIRGKELNPTVGSHGYKEASLTHLGKVRRVLIHRVVAEVYIDNDNQLPVVNHIDGNKLNNSVGNLEWCSRRENATHSREGKTFGVRPTRNGRYRAAYRKNGVRVYLKGSFPTKEEAFSAYKIAVQQSGVTDKYLNNL